MNREASCCSPLQDTPGHATTVFQDMVDLWSYARWWVAGEFHSAHELQRHLILLGAQDRRHLDEVRGGM